MCATCTWRSVCDTWGHAVPLYAVMGQWNQVMVAQGSSRVAVDLVAHWDGHWHVVVGRGHGLRRTEKLWLVKKSQNYSEHCH